MKVSEEKKEVKTTSERLLFLGKVFFLVFLAATVAFTVIYSCLDKENYIVKDKVTYIEHWNVTDADGNRFETGRSFRDNKKYNGSFTIESNLPEVINEKDVICFGVNLGVELYINDKLRFSVDNDNAFMLRYMLVPMPAVAVIPVCFNTSRIIVMASSCAVIL